MKESPVLLSRRTFLAVPMLALLGCSSKPNKNPADEIKAIAQAIFNGEDFTQARLESLKSLADRCRPEELNKIEILDSSGDGVPILNWNVSQYAMYEKMDMQGSAMKAERHKKLLEHLLKLKVDVNSRASENGYTPLIIAIRWDSPRTMEILLKHKADPNLQTNNGQTPLHWAYSRVAHYVKMETLSRMEDLLIKAGARMDIPDINGVTPEKIRKSLKLPQMNKRASNPLWQDTVESFTKVPAAISL